MKSDEKRPAGRPVCCACGFDPAERKRGRDRDLFDSCDRSLVDGAFGYFGTPIWVCRDCYSQRLSAIEWRKSQEIA